MERFMEQYQGVYKDLYRMAFYYLGSAADAEDAVQETALKAYEHFRKLKNPEAFRPWIFKILVNCCKRHLRKRYRPEQFLADLEGGGEAVFSYEPELSSQAEMLELLTLLSQEERFIVTLSVFGGYKGEEIARILGKNHSTIRSKYRRALKKLEQEIGSGKEMQG